MTNSVFTSKLCNVFIFFATFLFQSCVNRKYEPIDNSKFESNIDLDKSTEIQNKNLKILSLIKLETSKQSQLSEISKIINLHGKYFVLDKVFSSVKVFDFNGKFLTNIGRIGQGNGEYLSADDFYVDDKQVFILSNNSRRIYKYNIFGKFISSNPVSFYASELEKLPNSDIAFFTNFNMSEENSNLLIVDNRLNIKRRYFPFEDKTIPTFDFTGFIEKSNSILYSAPLDDSVFSVDGKAVYLKYKFNFGTAKCPDSVRNDINKVLKQMKRYVYIEKPIIETKTNLFFRYIYKGKVKYSIYNRKNKQLFTSNDSSLTSITSKPVGFENQNCIGVISYQNYFDNKNAIIDKYILSHYPALNKHLKIMTYSDNPIVIKYTYINNL